jgi:hypothetical protein
MIKAPRIAYMKTRAKENSRWMRQNVAFASLGVLCVERGNSRPSAGWFIDSVNIANVVIA